MLRHSRSVISGLGAVLALGCLLIGLEVSATTALPGAEPARHLANRTLKGDRLPVPDAKARKNAVNGPLEIRVPRLPAAKLELPEGCESIVSAIAQSPLSQVPGRCVS
jgi:hypothetical protein